MENCSVKTFIQKVFFWSVGRQPVLTCNIGFTWLITQKKQDKWLSDASLITPQSINKPSHNKHVYQCNRGNVVENGICAKAGCS